MDTKILLNKAIEQHKELLSLKADQESIQKIIKKPCRGQAMSTHICLPYVGQLLEAFWNFCKSELNYEIYGLLSDNGISITELWLKFLMFTNYNERWNCKQKKWIRLVLRGNK